MLAEWFTHLTTPCHKPFRDMGYLGELIAIKHRHARCKQAWEPHLLSCKSLVSEAAHQIKNPGSVVVLGSGQLLDIPIEVLSQTFGIVYLVDVCHLKNSRKRTRKLNNIRWIEADISGTVAPLMAWNPGETLPQPTPHLDILGSADFVVSSNLLAQLPLAPLHFVETKIPDIDPTIRDAYAQKIMEQHLSLLTELSTPVTLISEVEHQVTDGDHVMEQSEPLGGIELPPADQEWWWELAPRPEVSPKFDLKLRVAGIADVNAAS